MATGRKIVPVSALDALAAGRRRRTWRPSAAWIDAQRGEVFASLYDADRHGLLSSRHRSPPTARSSAGDRARRACAASSSATARSATRPSSASGSARPHAVLPPPPLRRHHRPAGGRSARPRGAAARGRPDLHSPAGRRAGPVAARASDLHANRRDGDRADLRCRRTSTPSPRSRPTRSPTPGRGTCSSASCASPTSRASMSSGCPATAWPRSAPAGSSTTNCTSTPSPSMPRLRRQGLATALMSHLLAEGAAQGARRTFLEVRRSNLPAQRLYERLGFTVASRPPQLLQPARRGRPGAVAALRMTRLTANGERI